MATFFTPAWYGLPGSGDRMYFYLTGTTTPATVYQDEDLSDAHANPVVADSNGVFPPIYLDPQVSYRMKAIRSAGDLNNPLRDDDPINPVTPVLDGSITADMLEAGAVTDSLGFTPVNKAGDTMTGDLVMNFTPTVLDQKSVGFRGAGATNAQNGAYTFALPDSGRGCEHTDASTPTWTIPPNSTVAFPVKTVIPISNTGTGSVTIARGSGVSLYSSGSTTDANKTLPQNTVATLFKASSNVWIVSGV
jgi:hypothetical protein